MTNGRLSFSEIKIFHVSSPLVGAPAYKLLGSLIAPDKPADKTYNDLVAVMKQHYCPKTAVVVQRFKFNSRVHQTRESIIVYVAELRRFLLNSCNYGAALNDMLRDCLVVGINDDHIQRRLLAEGDLSFEKALEMALEIEAIGGECTSYSEREYIVS